MLKVTKSPRNESFIRARAHAYRGYGYLVTWLRGVYLFVFVTLSSHHCGNHLAKSNASGYRRLTVATALNCGINNCFQGVAAHE